MAERTVTITTESTAGIPDQLANRLGIQTIPGFVAMGEGSFSDTKVSSDVLLMWMKNNPRKPVTTSAPSPELIEQTFDQIHGEIVHIATGSKFSSFCTSAEQTASARHGRVEVFDSGAASIGLGLLAILAAEQASTGATKEQILAQLEQTRDRLEVRAIPGELWRVIKGGRVVSAAGNIVLLLENGFGLKALLRMDHNQPQFEYTARTYKRVWTEMLGKIGGQKIRVAAIAHFGIGSVLVNDPIGGITESLNSSSANNIFCWEAAPTIAAHNGPGSVGVAIVRD
jgi:DegV family protein with EDD domain